MIDEVYMLEYVKKKKKIEAMWGVRCEGMGAQSL